MYINMYVYIRFLLLHGFFCLLFTYSLHLYIDIDIYTGTYAPGRLR